MKQNMINPMNQEHTKMTGAVQTMLTWTKVLCSKEEIPAAYIPIFDDLTAHCRGFPYTLLAPPMKNRWYKPAERLLIYMEDQLIVLQKRSKLIHQQSIPLNPAIDLEMGNSLLFSWITLRDIQEDAQTCELSIPFNTASARHYEPILQKIRPGSREDVPVPPQDYPNLRKALISADFKFNAFARESLRTDEMVLASLWQPAFKKPVFKLGQQPFFHRTAPAHMSILTSRELILLWDDERSLENRGVRYGGVRRFIPIQKIKTGRLIEADNKVCHFQIQMLDESQILRTFGIENQKAVRSFSQRLASLISAQEYSPG